MSIHEVICIPLSFKEGGGYRPSSPSPKFAIESLYSYYYYIYIVIMLVLGVKGDVGDRGDPGDRDPEDL